MAARFAIHKPHDDDKAKWRKNMADKKGTIDSSGVDKGLVAMFLKMTPEERVKANDNMVRTIEELRNAFKQRKTDERRPGSTP